MLLERIEEAAAESGADLAALRERIGGEVLQRAAETASAARGPTAEDMAAAR